MPHQRYQSVLDAAVHCAYECEHCEDACLLAFRLKRSDSAKLSGAQAD